MHMIFFYLGSECMKATSTLQTSLNRGLHQTHPAKQHLIQPPEINRAPGNLLVKVVPPRYSRPPRRSADQQQPLKEPPAALVFLRCNVIGRMYCTYPPPHLHKVYVCAESYRASA